MTRTTRTLLLLGCAQAMALTAGPLAAQPKVDTPSIRVVLRGFAKMPQYTDYLSGLVNLCVAAKKLPAGSVVIPSAQVLAALPILEEETLFDGYWAATFKTSTSVQPDLEGNCRVMLLRTYSARVDKSCSHMMAASTDGQESDIAAGRSPNIDIVRDQRAADDKLPAKERCKAQRQKVVVPVNGLPLIKTAQGAPCIWSHNLSNRELELMGRAELVDKRAPTQDLCLHPKWQLYPTNDWSGQDRVTVLKTFKSLRTMGDTDLADAMPTAHAANQDAYVFEEGQPIAAARFTEAAVRAHVSQPAWISIGKP